MKRQTKKTLLALCLFLPSTFFISIAQADSPTVLTTVKPLQLISTAITDGVAKTALLLPVNASPHDYQLKPSDMKKLKQADIIVWVGPELEAFLSKVIDQQRSSSMLTLGEAIRDQEAEHNDEEEHGNDEHEGHEDDHEEHSKNEMNENDHHDHGGVDPHIWLSPENAVYIAELIAKELKRIDPSHKTQYSQNLSLFTERVEQADKSISAQLEPLRDRGYFVFHDAYNNFEKHYGLKHLGAFTLSPERKPGAKHLQEIQQQIKTQNALCVFREPQFQPRIIDAVTQGLSINVGTLDPLASNIEVNSQGYIHFMHQLAEQFEQCLAPN